MRTRRGGFIMIVAITMLAFCAAAVVVVMQLAHDDARRTIDERIDAQRRQLLIAGLRDVGRRLDAGESPLAAGEINVPAEAGATLAVDGVESLADGRVLVTIRSETLVQRATFTRGDSGAWTLERAEIVR